MTVRPFKTRFRCGYTSIGLTSPMTITRRLIRQKARRQTFPEQVPGIVLRLVTGKRFQVLFHYPHRVTFHLSLTVLVHYRSAAHIQPWKVVLPDSSNISRVPEYLGIRHGSPKVFAYGTVTLCGPVFQPVLLTSEFVTSAGVSRNP